MGRSASSLAFSPRSLIFTSPNLVSFTWKSVRNQ
jgi:hypothetical protein